MQAGLWTGQAYRGLDLHCPGADTVVVNLPPSTQEFLTKSIQMRAGGAAALIAIGLPFFVFNFPVYAGMLVGHRGGTATRKPENTLASFEYAYSKGATHVECDVRTTSDGYVVLMHDPTVARTTDGYGLINNLTLEQIRTLDAGARFGSEAGKGIRVPRLMETLELAKSAGRGVLLDIKESGMAVKVLREVTEAGISPSQVSFVHSSLELLKEYRPLFPVNEMYIVAGGSGSSWKKTDLNFWRTSGATGFLFWGNFQSRIDIAAMHESGLKLMVINGGPDGVYQMTENGIDGVMTDYIEETFAAYRSSSWSKWCSDCGLSVASNEMSADPDGDGSVNLLEYAAGTDPVDSTSGAGGGALSVKDINVQGGRPAGDARGWFNIRSQKLPVFSAKLEISRDRSTWNEMPSDWVERVESAFRIEVPSSAQESANWIRMTVNPIP